MQLLQHEHRVGRHLQRIGGEARFLPSRVPLVAQSWLQGADASHRQGPPVALRGTQGRRHRRLVRFRGVVLRLESGLRLQGVVRAGGRADPIVQNRPQGDLVVLLQAHRRAVGAGPIDGIGQPLDQGFISRRDCVTGHDDYLLLNGLSCEMGNASRPIHEDIHGFGV